MQPPQTLSQLRSWAEREGLEHVLDAPILEIFNHLERITPAPSMLGHLVHEHECTTLREMLDHPSADPCLRGGTTKRIRLAFVSSLEDWLATQANGRSRPPQPGLSAPTRVILKPPSDLPGLRSWAAEHQVLDRLADSWKALHSRLPSSYWNALIVGLSGISEELDRKIATETLCVEDLLVPRARRPAPSPRRPRWAQHIVPMNPGEEVARIARDYLFDVARAASFQREVKRALDARSTPPEEPAAQRLAQRADAAGLRLAEGRPRRPLGTYVPRSTGLDKDPLRFVYREAIEPRFGAIEAKVEIAIEEDPLAGRCSCGISPEKGCDHALSAMDALLDLLRDPAHPARKQLFAELRTPGWTRFLRAVGEGVAAKEPAGAAPTERLIYRISARFSPPAVEVLIQKPLKRGGWSVGQKIRADDLEDLRDLSRDPRDARVIDALTDDLEDTFGYRPPSRKRVFRVLSALAGHPRVFLENRNDVPARIEKSRIKLVLEPSSEGVRLVLALGAQRISPAELLRSAGGSEQIIVIDPNGPSVTLGTLDAQAMMLVSALAKFPASFPPESHDDLLRLLQPLQESVELELPEAMQGEARAGDLRPVLRISPSDSSRETEVAIRIRPIEGGPCYPPGEGPNPVLHAALGKRIAAHRALVEEPGAARAILERLPLPRPEPSAPEGGAEGDPWTFTLPGEESLLDLLAVVRSLGDAVAVEWPEQERKLTLTGPAQRRELKLRVTSQRDWFGVEGEIAIDGEQVSFAALLDAVRKGRRYVEVGPHRFAAIEDDLRKRLSAASDLLFNGRHGLELGLPGAAAIADLIDDPGQLEAVTRWHDLVRRIDAARALDPVVPQGLAAVLRPYQIDGYRWLARLAAWGMGGCLADDMGLGKTVQALALLLHRRELGPALVIAPTSVGPNWLDEAARFAPSLRVRLYRGLGRGVLLEEAQPGDVLVTSYGLATRDAAELAALRFSTLILDEAQAIKNALTRRARAVRDLQADFRIALTGTPVENHLGELWSLMRVLAPGLFGSWDQFRERFAGPIERSRDPERSAALARTIRPFMLRRTKAEVAPELPPRIEIARFIDPSAAERRLYDEARRTALAAIASGEGDARFILLAALTRLRRLACHPRLFDPSSTVPSSKLAALLEVVSELREEGHRALLFSQFTSHLALVREALDREKVSYTYLDGGTPSEERTKRIAAFQAGDFDLFLISLKAGGTGLNLTAATYVIHLDPWWNPAVEDQATDRAHRIGQSRAVTVIRLILRGTIEESVLSLHGEKRALSASLFDEEGGPARLSVDDLADLIRVGAASGSGEEPAEDEAGDVLGAEVIAEDAPRAPSKPPLLNAMPRTAVSGLPTDEKGLHALGEGLLDRLAEKRGVLDRRYDNTLRTYERTFRRFIEYMTATWSGKSIAGEEIHAVLDGYLGALRSGEWPAPQSEPGLAKVVMNHLRAFLASPAG